MTGTVRQERDGEIAVLLIDNPPVNASSTDVRRALLDAVQRVEDDSSIEAAIIIGAGNTFVAGSDIREFGKPIPDPQLPAVIAAIQNCPKAFVAAIHGAALGGGFELALGCDGRIAASEAVVGFPEVTLGMIPGAGGTQYLPRLAGIAAAIEMICSGRRIGATEAKQRGLIDAIAEGELRAGAVALARRRQGHKRPLGAESVAPESADAVEKAASDALRAGRNRPQIVAAIEAVKSAATLPFQKALAKERAVFQTLRMSNEAAALRHLFFAERLAGKVEGLEGTTPQRMKRAAVVGAGTMGAGIAMCFADASIPVTLIDRDEASVQRGFDVIRSFYERAASSGRISAEDASRRLKRITPAASLEALQDVDLVVEAVFEELDVKKAVLACLDCILGSEALLASNTSYLNLDQLAAATGRPDKVVGLHFFNPAQTMRLLEVVRGASTSRETLATALELAKRLRKLAVVARVGEGFIGNRIFAAYRRQCEFMLEEGAYPEEIDAALEEFGFAMGPFAVADLSGLDTAWRMRKRLAPTRDPRQRYCEIPDRLCEQGRLGRKTGAGWFAYKPGERKGTPDPYVRTLIDTTSASAGLVRRAFGAQEIVRRAVMTMVNEAALLLSEGIAARPSDIDVVLVNGYGFPKHEGGPLFWASRQDRGLILSELQKLAAVSGYGFRAGDVAGLLDQLRTQE
jgi:3-hydroxyacyl-CoA dehydrogenase